LFAARFVLIGFNSTGLQDRVVTRLVKACPAWISTPRSSRACSPARPQRPYWATWMELGILLASGLLLIGFLPILRARYAVAVLSRWRP
jgi:CHASE2 domain-containing sensor protein